MKYLFIDMDATICDFGVGDGRVIVSDFTNEKGFFLNKSPIKIVLKAIEVLFPRSKYEYHILSASPTEMGVEEKEVWLDKNFFIEKEKRHFVRYPDESKAVYIQNFCLKHNINPVDCVLLDDTQRHLEEAEGVGVYVMHPINLICRYEKYLDR